MTDKRSIGVLSSILARRGRTGKVEPMRPVTPKTRSGIRAIFDVFDNSQNGHVSSVSLGALLSQLGLQYDAAVLKEVMKEFDTDANGTLEFDEFVELVLGPRKVRTGKR